MNKIFTFGFNRPDLLERQFNTIKSNIVGDYEFYLVYDHLDETHTNEFQKVCYEHGIDMYDHLRDTNLGNSQNHASSLQWIYDNFIEDEDRVLFLDHDIFLIDKFDFDMYFDSYDIAGLVIEIGGINFFWPGVFGFKYDKIKKHELNFFPGVYKNVFLDTLGSSYKLLEDKTLKINKFCRDFINIDSFGFELFDDKFIHLYGASKWYENFVVNEKDTLKQNELFDYISLLSTKK